MIVFWQATESTIKWDGQVLILTILAEKKTVMIMVGIGSVHVLTRGKRWFAERTNISSDKIVNENI